jgi:PHP family Zn ribbon phosphoesterase
LKKLAPFLERVPQTLRGIAVSEVSKVEGENTRVEGRSTEVGTLTDVREVGKVYIVPGGGGRLGLIGMAGMKRDEMKLTAERAHE